MLAETLGGRGKAAKAAGLSSDQFLRIIRGQSEPSLASMVQLAESAGVTVDWLATGRDSTGTDSTQPRVSPYETARDADLHQYFLPPAGAAERRDGSGRVVSEQIVDLLAFKQEWIWESLQRDPADLVLVRVVGDAMEPTIADGALALVDLSRNTVRDAAIYAIIVDNSILFRRIQNGIKSATLMADNTRYDKETIDRNELKHLVFGQVVWVGTDV